jgi:hypothetical protein
LLECFEEAVDPRSGNAVAAVEQEGDEVARHVYYMGKFLDLVKDAWC